MENKILNILGKIRPEFDFRISSNFIDDGMLDSFDIITLVTELDKAFSISIDGVDVIPENFINLKTIERLLVKSGAQK
jgi:acyl carrier protein